MNNTRKIPTDLLEELDKRLLSYSRPGNLYILLQVQTPSEVFLRCLQRKVGRDLYAKFQVGEKLIEYQRRAINI
jgi:hypothetical protein